MPASVQPTAITEQTTQEFRQDLARLSGEDRTRVRAALRSSYELLRSDRRRFFASAKRPQPVQLKSGLTSSLYSLPVGRDLRLILAVDDDPVFAQTIVTLFRAIRPNEVGRTYRSIADRIYRNGIERNGGH